MIKIAKPYDIKISGNKEYEAIIYVNSTPAIAKQAIAGITIANEMAKHILPVKYKAVIYIEGTPAIAKQAIAGLTISNKIKGEET